MRPRPFSTRIVPIIVALSVVCFACTSQPGATSTASAAAEAASQVVVSASPESPSPAPTATALPTATGEPSTGPAPSPMDSPMAGPPAARLAVEGGDPVVGELGSFTWNNAGSDAPWLPGHPIHVSTTEHVTFTLAGAVPIETWHVARVLSSAVPGGDGVVGMADGTGSVIGFDAPPAGRWSVTVRVRFGGNLGDAAYYWAVTVD